MWRRTQKQQQQQKQKIVQQPVSSQYQMARRQVIVGVLLCIAISIILTTIWYVTRLSVFQIKEVQVTGGFTIPHETIRDIAQTELRGTYLRLIPKQFGPLYPERAIRDKISQISRVKNVLLERDDDNNLQIVFEEYRPFALWCSAEESSKCLFIDHTGLAFAPAPPLTGAAFVRYLTDDEPVTGAVIANQAFLDDSVVFSERLEAELELFVTHVELRGDYDVEYTVAGGGQIKLSQSIPMLDSFNNLKTILTSEDFSHLEPGDFNYIDLRFGDKVFVSEEIVPEYKNASGTATST